MQTAQLPATNVNYLKKVRFSICDDGTLGIVPIFAWVSKRPKVNNIRRYVCKFTQEAHAQIDNY